MSALIEAEEALLGVLLISPEAIPGAVAQLTESDFSQSHTARFFGMIARAHANGSGTDALSIAAMFSPEDRKKVKQWIGQKLSGYPRSNSVSDWAALIKRESVRRQALRLLADYSGKLSDEGEDVGALLSELTASAISLGRSRDRADFLDNKSLVDTALRSIEARVDAPEGVLGVASGLKNLDAKARGFRPGQLIGVVGLPGDGKTSLLHQIGLHNARQGKHVALFSCEGTGEEVMERLLAMESFVNPNDLQRKRKHDPKGYESDWQALTIAAGKAGEPYFHVSEGNFAVQDIESLCLDAVNRHGLDLVLVDYFQLLKRPGRKDIVVELKDISIALKQLAVKLRVPIVLAMQMKSDVDSRTDRAPTLMDIGDCKQPAKDCDKLVMIHRWKDKASDTWKSRLVLSKNRNGFTGFVRAYFEPNLTRFFDGDSPSFNASTELE